MHPSTTQILCRVLEPVQRREVRAVAGLAQDRLSVWGRWLSSHLGQREPLLPLVGRGLPSRVGGQQKSLKERIWYMQLGQDRHKVKL